MSSTLYKASAVVLQDEKMGMDKMDVMMLLQLSTQSSPSIIKQDVQVTAARDKSVPKLSSTSYEASAFGLQDEKIGRDEINVVMMLPPPPPPHQLLHSIFTVHDRARVADCSCTQ